MQHRALLYAPWVLALLGSCVICAVALAITRIIGYRPGGIPPVLAALFAIPVFLFHTQVGQDELEFRVLEQEIGPGSSEVFVTVDLKEEANRSATRRWSETRGESYDEIYRAMLDRKIAEAQVQAEMDRLRAVERCDSFMERFAKSPHIPDVLFLRGRAQDQRLQHMRLLVDLRAEYRSDMPTRTSRHTWETLEKEFPGYPQTAAALFKLAVLRARDGKIDRAIDTLSKLTERFDAATTTQGAGPATDRAPSVFRRPAMAGLSVETSIMVLQARRLREMLTACRDDKTKPYAEIFALPSSQPDETVHPVQLLLQLDDASLRYRDNLERIARSFPDSETAGYVMIRRAMLELAISRRIQRFQQAAQTLAGRPSGAEALFQLGDARQDDSLLDEAKAAFDQLVKDYPDSCWAAEAKERLSSLPMLEATREGGG